MIVSLIAACSRNRVIGSDGKLPWDLPDDLKHFRKLTSGHPVIMGRKTFESIGRPLPNRQNLVISRQARTAPEGVRWVGSLDEALRLCPEGEVFVIGGGEIYSLALPRADRIYLTEVDAEIDGDAVFPDWRQAGEFVEVSRERHPRDERHAHSFDCLRLDRSKRTANEGSQLP